MLHKPNLSIDTKNGSPSSQESLLRKEEETPNLSKEELTVLVKADATATACQRALAEEVVKNYRKILEQLD